MTHPPIGIDLGTTYSAVAVFDEKGEPRLLPNLEGKYLTPSVVFFEADGNIVVGEVAKDARADHPEQVVEFIKRSMGVDRKFFYANREFTPIELSGLILKKLKQDAEAALGVPITRAVVTCPAYFGAERRDATEKAATIAGLSVLSLVNEPTAAALSFGMGGDKTGTVLVFDLGGGTFDVTLIRFADGNTIDVLASDGDAELGGKDFDDEIIVMAAEQLLKESGYDVYGDMEALAELRQKAEKAKHDVSARESTTLSFAAGAHKLRMTLTRDAFSKAIQPHLQGMRFTLQSVLTECNLTTRDINDILLVGGSTRIPAVREMVRDFFGKEPNTTIHPDEAVALGASLFAVKLLAADRSETMAPVVRERARGLPSVLDIAPHSIGTTALDGGNQEYNSIILPRGEKLPASITERYFTVADGQMAVKVDVNEGEDVDLNFVNRLGEFVLRLPVPRPAGSPIDIQVALDLSGIIRVAATDTLSGQHQRIEINYEVNMSEAQVKERTRWLQNQTIT